jgi:hypothetical protein
MTEDLSNEGLPVWFPPREIAFTRTQLELFLLPQLNNLRFGSYPNEPEEYITYVKGTRMQMKRSGYEKSKWKWRTHLAPFVIAVEMAAEIDARLDMCPLHFALWVEENLVNGFEYDEVSRKYRVREDQVRRGIGQVLRYIAGWDRPQYLFCHWQRARQKALLNMKSK